MITLIGVGHVFRIREVVEHLISQRAPQVVGVELDKLRYQALLSDDMETDAPFLIRRLMKSQEEIAGKYGASVGEEMMSAIDTAMKLDINVAFIDVPTQKSLKPVFSSIGFKEKLYLFGSALTAPFLPKKKIEKELKRFEDNPDQVMKILEKKMPELKHQLIDARDDHMAKAIIAIHNNNPDVVAVIGDGHILGITRKLKKAKIKHEVIRLRQVRELAKRIPVKEEPVHKTLGKERVHRIRFGYLYTGEWAL
jgi:pheromone shutdown protein TraB